MQPEGNFEYLKGNKRSKFGRTDRKDKESLRYMLELGVTTVEAKSGYGLSLEQEINNWKQPSY